MLLLTKYTFFQMAAILYENKEKERLKKILI